MKQKISVVINTLNEEDNISYALRSVQSWADEIIVVDMHSEDRTVEIAEKFGAKVFFHERIAAFDGARQFAIDQASNEWILILDADEIVPEPLSRTFLNLIATEKFDVIFIPWLNYMLGAPIMHSGWGPEQDMHSRLFRKNKLATSSIIHEPFKIFPDAKIHFIKYEEGQAIIHFNYININHFLKKLNIYTDIEAKQSYERRENSAINIAIYLATKEFLNRYFRKKGYKDGWRGFYLSIFMSFYRIATQAKINELYEFESRDKIIEHYNKIAKDVLKKYSIDDTN